MTWPAWPAEAIDADDERGVKLGASATWPRHGMAEGSSVGTCLDRLLESVAKRAEQAELVVHPETLRVRISVEPGLTLEADGQDAAPEWSIRVSCRAFPAEIVGGAA